MNFKAELTAMKGRLFSPELYQAMGEASTQRRRERGLTWKDAIWRRAQAQLDPQLTPDQKDRLDQLRRQCQETGEYAAVVAFQNGLYTGFQQVLPAGHLRHPLPRLPPRHPAAIHQPQTEDPLPRPPGGRPGPGRCPDPVPA